MATVAGWRVLCLGLMVLALLGGTSAANAGIIDIFSDTSGTYFSTFASGTGFGNDVTIPTSPAWATPPTLGAAWVSYAPASGNSTGCNLFVPTTGRCVPDAGNPPGSSSAPTATFYATFTLPDAFNTGSIQIWADDTAEVYLDFGTVTSGDGSTGSVSGSHIPANFTLGGNCASGPIGCTQANDGVLNFGTGLGQLDLGAGTYTLVIDAYQLVGGSPFGVMYSGAIDSEPTAPVPEPVSYVLMGLGLAALGILIPRRKRS